MRLPRLKTTSDALSKYCKLNETKSRVIMPERKEYVYQESPRVRVAAYCRVSTAEEAQMGSLEMQVQHFQTVIDNNPTYKPVKIYTNKGVESIILVLRGIFSICSCYYHCASGMY